MSKLKGRTGRPNKKLPVPTREELARGAGFLRQSQIIPHLLPIAASTWWAGIERGVYPRPRKVAPDSRSIAWSMRDIHQLLERLENSTSSA